MLEMHKLTRYEWAPVVKFGPQFNASQDASALDTWLQDFCRDRGKPPRLLSFTFHAIDGDADSICQFMKMCVSIPNVAALLTQIDIELLFVGGISDSVVAETHERISSQQF